jgi:hypothetical protein
MIGRGVFAKLMWVLAVALLALPAVARAQTDSYDSHIHLSWRDAYGQPRAVDNLAMTCDTTLEDTLFLTMEPAKDSPTFNGFTATLYFHAPQGDSLSPVWRVSEKQNPEWLEVVFDTDRNAAVAAPWPRGQGLNTWSYDVTSGSGRLRLAFGTSKTGSTKKNHRYVLARVLIRHPARAPRCEQPICIEWNVANLSFDFGDEQEVNRGARFVSMNGRGACDGYMPAKGPAPWKPKSGDTKTR